MKTSFFLFSLSISSHAAVITQWNFDASTTTPSTGSGTASLLSTATATFSAGNNSSAAGWNTSTYAAQSTGSGTVGVQFAVPTTGYESITITFDHRASNTASRWSQIDYSLNGSTWTTAFWNNGGNLVGDTWTSGINVDFSAITGANDNANFAIRIVSIFSPLAFDQNASLADFAANSAYMRARQEATNGASFTSGGGTGTSNYANTGTWRFDNVTFNGNAIIPETSSSLLGCLAAFTLLRRNRKA